MTDNKNTVLAAMSGGVDSSAAALILKQRGYDITGCTMKLYENKKAGIPDEDACCFAEEDEKDAKLVCQKLGIPHHIYDYRQDFRSTVIESFIEGYEKGLTPNPCVECNRFFKFGALFDCADELGINYIATGHYARIEERDGLFYLMKAKDPIKDQSYFLCTLTQDKLSRILFPLGDMDKQAVRELAARNGLVNSKKGESQDICFVPDGDYASVIEKYSGKSYHGGDFIDDKGNVLGRHRGIIHYTVGQRRGLGISAEAPLYVRRIDAENNTVILGGNDDLFSRTVTACDMNWIAGRAPEKEISCRAKIRYRQSEQPARVCINPDGSVTALFDEPQRAVTPGQMLVLYDGDAVIGGGMIADCAPPCASQNIL